MALYTAKLVGDVPKLIPAVYRNPVTFSMVVPLDDTITASNNQLAANDIIELVQLPAYTEVGAISITKTAAVSAALDVGILRGNRGDATPANRVLDVDLGALGANATAFNIDYTMGNLRSADHRDEPRVLGFRATAASSAGETAELRIMVTLFSSNPSLEANQ